MKVNEWSRQQELKELRDFSKDLLTRVEKFRKELKEYGGVHIEQTDKFFKDVDKIKDERVARVEQIGKVSGMGAEMAKTYQQMKNQMEDLQKLKAVLEKMVAGIDAKVTRANKDLLAVLENEYKLYEDRLSVMKETIEDLKKD